MKHHHKAILAAGLIVGSLLIWHFGIHSGHWPFADAAFVDHAHKGGFDGVPVNLRVTGKWDATLKKRTAILKWDSVPDAAFYTIYQYDIKVGTTTDTTFTIPFDKFVQSMTATVTATNTAGAESIPSNVIGYTEFPDPLNPPNWATADPARTPTTVTATPEWNKGKPRIHLEWLGTGIATSYSVYRDGQKVAEGLWGLNYFDENVQPGETHSYEIVSVKDYWPTRPESAKTTPVSATAMSGPPAAINQKVNLKGIVRNDDSFVVIFDPVPGAVDYRIYKDGDEVSSAKYAGWRYSSTTPPDFDYSIEQNNVIAPGNYIIEAVDKLGPFQKMDGDIGPGGAHGMATNGQGDPSNEPIVLARSDVFIGSNKPRELTNGTQIFFDKFQDTDPWVTVPFSDPITAARRYVHDLSQFENPRWIIQGFTIDQDFSRFFTVNRHFMDTTYDGPSPLRASFSHNNNASTVMFPKTPADISGGKVLHVTFEADMHNDSRRWMDVMIGGVDDLLIEPGKFFEFNQDVTPKNQIFRWQILDSTHEVSLFDGKRTDGTLIQKQIIQETVHFRDPNRPATARTTLFNQNNEANGTNQDIDKRHIFDMYLSKNHVKITETAPDGKYTVVAEKDFPAGAELPWDKVNVYFVHQVYHTGNDRPDLVEYSQGKGKYWYNYRPYADERHWDNMGYEVLNDFSNANPTILPIEPVVIAQANAKANVNVTQSVDKASAKAGDTLTYTLQLENLGGTAANHVSLVASIPSVTEFVTASNSGVANSTSVSWNELTLAPLERITRTFQVRIK